MNPHQNEATVTLIEQRLQAALEPSLLEIVDDSDAHIGHSGAIGGGGHFILKIRSQRFHGLSLLQQHRLIYAELDDLIPEKIHALSLDVGAT